MDLGNFVPYAGAVLLYLGTQVAPSLKTLTDHLVMSRIKKSERSRDSAQVRADEAAVLCQAELNDLRELLPKYATVQRSAGDRESIEEKNKIKHSVDQSIARLETALALLPPEARVRMGKLASILAVAPDLTFEPRYGEGWHPDSCWAIARNCVRHGNDVLAAHLRRDALPSEPDPVVEYALAVADREADLNAEYAQDIAEHDDAIKTFRKQHGLSPERAS